MFYLLELLIASFVAVSLVYQMTSINTELTDKQFIKTLPEMITTKECLDSMVLLNQYACLLMLLSFIAGIVLRPEIENALWKLTHTIRNYKNRHKNLKTPQPNDIDYCGNPPSSAEDEYFNKTDLNR